MMSNIEWGDEIPVNRVRPAWLKDDDRIQWVSDGRSIYGPARGWLAANIATWSSMIAIKLPADHLAYVAIERGLEPWTGGDQAPADWDHERPLLLRDGRFIVAMPRRYHRDRSVHCVFESSPDIIGYHKRATPDTKLIKWGGGILVGGKRPTWLKDDDLIRWRDESDRAWCPRRQPYQNVLLPERAVDVADWGKIRLIKLPFDHFAYHAIKVGFEPWGGGTAPGDWDEGNVLRRDGVTIDASYCPRGISWAHWGNEQGSDIIGYRKRTDAMVDTLNKSISADITWIRDTLGEAYGHGCQIEEYMLQAISRGRETAISDHRTVVWGWPTPKTRREATPDTVSVKPMTEPEAIGAFYGDGISKSPGAMHVDALRKLGLIREETPLERFQREAGYTVADDARPAVEAALSWATK